MGIIGAAFFPHPPIVLPEVGKGQEKGAQATLDGMGKLAALVADMKPEAIALVTPHGPAFADAIAVADAHELSGTLAQFGAPAVRISKAVNMPLLKAFAVEAKRIGAPVAALDAGALSQFQIKPGLDHGALVPLYFIDRQYTGYTILHISPGGQPLRRQYEAGMALGRAAEASGLRVLVLASGDLSHKLTESGPYGFDEAGPLFDAQVSSAMRQGDPAAILAIDPALARRAGECGWRPAAFALGALDGMALDSRLLSYEGPFGVGYMTALLTPAGPGAQSALHRLDAAGSARAQALRQGEDNYVHLARQSIGQFVRTGKAPHWEELKPELAQFDTVRMERAKAGAFVSLHLDGELRGCMGTIVPVTAHVGEEIIHNAVTACSEDPRFPAVEQYELDSLEIKVDVLSPFEPVASPADLNPRRFGVIVEKGGRRGLLLPNLEGVDTVERQLDIACRKAGFQWKGGDDAIRLFRFTVERHGGED